MRHRLLILAALATSLASDPAMGRKDITVEQALACIDRAASALNRSVLENGTVVLILEDHSAPVVSVQIWIKTGSIHEGELLGSGLSHAIEHMIFKGTEKRGVGQITREINDAGGDINAYTSFDRTVFHADLPSRHWRVGVDVLSDAVRNATFPEEEWVKEKEVILREIAMCNDDPGRLVDYLLWETAFTSHPYRFPIIGHREIFERLTRDDLSSFARRNYAPDNMIVAIVGDIDPAEVEAAVRESFKGFGRKARPAVVLPEEPRQIAPRIRRREGEFNICRIELAWHTIPLTHPDAPALDLLAAVVGEGRSSRLVRRIKEEKRLVHSINAWHYTPREPGLFGISMLLDPEQEDAALAAVEEEAASWTRARFSEAELQKARRMMLTSELADLQTMRGMAAMLAEGEFYAGDPMFSRSYLKKIESVTPADLRDVAKRYLTVENRTIAVVAPKRKLSPSGTGKDVKTAMRVERHVFPNGTPLVVREDHRLPFAYAVFALTGGVIYESEKNNGATKLLSELLLKGTKKRTRDEVAEQIESAGAHMAPFCGFNSFGIQLRCLSADLPRFLDLAVESLVQPALAPEEIEKEKDAQMAAIEAERERPMYLAQEQLRAALFAGHPYRFHPLGTPESLNRLDRDSLTDHLSRLVVAGNLAVAVFGDVSAESVKVEIGKLVERIPSGKRPHRLGREATPSLPARVERREPREQAVVLAGFPGVSLTDPRADALSLLHYALSGLSSDLADSVRERRGLAYYVGAYNQLGVDPGAFVFYAGTREDAVPEVLSLYEHEIERLARQGLRKEELERARNQIVADFEMQTQDNLGFALNCALDELYGLGYEHTLKTAERFTKLTAEDIRAAAQTILSTNRMAVSVVLPRGSAK